MKKRRRKPLKYIFKNNIALAITGTSNSVSVAEHVMTMFLYLTKKINLSNNLVKSGNFKKKSELPDFFELYQKNLTLSSTNNFNKNSMSLYIV